MPRVAWAFFYLNTVCMREVQVQTRMRICPESPEPSSISILCVSKRCRFRQECAYAQSRLSLLLSPYCVYARGAGSDRTAHMPRVAWAFFYLHTVCMREVQVQTRLRVCPESPEPSCISILCVCERCRFRQDCAYAQSRLSFLLSPYCVYVRGAGSDKTAHMPRVVWAFFYLHTVCMREVQV